MHHIDSFKSAVNKHMPGPNMPTAATLAKWLIDEGFELYQKAFTQETSMAPSGAPDNHLIEQAFARGMDDAARKRQQSAFFAANASIFLSIGREIAGAVCKAASHPMALAFEPQHVGLLSKLVADAQWLLEEWAAANQNVPGTFGIYKNPYHHPLSISHAVEQLYFGGSPFFAFADNASESSVAVLRVAIETRLRWGFGVLGCITKSDGAFKPLGLTKLLNAIKKHEGSITLAVPISNVSRIYKWSNTYIHTGVRDYIWLPMFASRYLVVLLRGGGYTGGSSANAGIITNIATIQAVQDEIVKTVDNIHYELLRLSPENCEAITN